MQERTFIQRKVFGLSVTTSNADEVDPEKAKIPQLWQSFHQSRPISDSGDAGDALFFGIYTNYESDYLGAFDVFVGSQTSSSPTLSEMTIPSGQYLVFSAQGEMPQAVIDLWGVIWRFFDDTNCPYVRKYTTDFECYLSENEVDIYIAV